MIRKGKKVLLPLVLLMSASTAFGLAACGETEEPEAHKYTVTYERGADDATGAIPASASYAEGESFKLLAADTFSREGYTFECWNDGTKAYAAGADYTMPAKDVAFKAIWELSAPVLPDNTVTLESVPQSEYRTAVTAGGMTATANWFAEYKQDAFVLTVYVEDEKVYTNGSIYENDSVEVVLDKAQRVKGYTDDTVSVIADAAGNVRVTKPKAGTEAVEDTGITAETVPYTRAGVMVEGYKTVITVPYSAVSFTQADKNAAVALTLTNAQSLLEIKAECDAKYGTDATNVHTYTCVTADNTFAANPDFHYSKVWGDVAKLKTSSTWNVDGDDGSAGAHIYMTGNDFADNYAYMHSSNASQMYAEVKLSVKEVMEKQGGGYDNLPKFGITITTADGKTGLFFWVGADCDGNTIKDNSITLGHTTRANGSWATWTDNIGNLGGTSAQYQGDEYVTLGIYRQGGALKLYANGREIKTVACGMKASDEAYIGLASFNLKLDAKDYKVTTNKSEFPAGAEITQENRDYVFLGDSYIDTAFWYNYENQFGALSAANMGVGGTKVGYWTDMVEIVKTMYNPGKLLFHIGVNDIDDGNTTGEATIERLKTMFAAYKAAFPDAEIYYVTIEHNMMFTQKWAEYDKVNAWVKTLDDIRVIDMASLITEDAEAGNTQHWFSADGLHYGVDGYALFNREICEAFGIARTENAGGLGDVTVANAPAFAYSAGWVETDGVWHNAGNSFNRVGAESQLFISEAYATDFYAEAEISVARCYADDAFPKTGIALRSATGTYFYALDCQKGANNNGTHYTNTWGNLWYRSEVRNRNWTGELYKDYQFLYDGKYDYNTDNAFKKLAVAKVGRDLYLFADDKVVNFYPDAYDADEKVAAAVFTFNMEAYAKNASAITEAAALKTKLDGFKVYENEGMRADGDMSDWTEEQKSNPYVIPATDGRSVTIYATKGADGIYVFFDAIHNTFKTDGEWHQATNVELKFNDGKQRFASATRQNSRWEVNTRQINASKFVSVAENGKQHTKAELFISYSCIDGVDRNTEVVPMGFAWKTGGEEGSAWAAGDYWYGPEADPNYTTKLVLVTDNGIKTGTERTIDGDLSDWASNAFTENTAAGSRHAALLADDGLYIAIEVKAPKINVNGTNTWHYTDDQGHWDSDWWKNTNIEFFGGGTHNTGRVMCFNGKLYHTGWITDAEMSYTHGDSEDTLVFEVFIANEHMKNVTSETQSVTIDIGGQLWWINDEGADTNAWKDYARSVTVNRA